MPKVKEIIVYSFDELSEEAQEHAIEKLQDINTDYEWWDDFELYKTTGCLIGIDIDNIYFSGFSSQGDGACFEGSYSYKKGGLAALKKEFPKWTEMHKIAKTLQEIQRANFYNISATIKHSGHYYHSLCTNITVRSYDPQTGSSYHPNNETKDQIIETLRNFMDEIYVCLEKDYEYLTSVESIKNTIMANDYTFDENGNLA